MPRHAHAASDRVYLVLLAVWQACAAGLAQSTQPLRDSAASAPASAAPPPASAASQLAEAASQPASAPESQPVGPKRLTLEAIYDGKEFEESVVRGLEWIDGEHYWQHVEGRLMRVHARSGESQPAYDDARIEAALRGEGLDETAAREVARRPAAWSRDRAVALLAHEGRLWTYHVREGRLRRIERGGGGRRELDLSPGGRYASFVQGNNLYAVDARSGWDRRLTHGGSPTRLNGVLDWVYQEEIYGRGRYRGYWWREDDRYVAFLQLDESQVPIYTMVQFAGENAPVETMRYPRAGDPNPKVRLGVASLGLLGGVHWVDLSRYGGTDILIVAVSWAPDGRLLFSVQDREQRWLELNECTPHGGGVRTLIRESSPAWVDTLGHPHWLGDGTFLWLSERSGHRHIYHYRRDGTLIRAVTAGDWDVRELEGVDEARGWVYFSGSCDTVLETHAYRTPLRGGVIERLTEPGYSHRVQFSRDFSLLIDTFSNISTPTKVCLREVPAPASPDSTGSGPAAAALPGPSPAAGSQTLRLVAAPAPLVRMLSENDLPALREYQLGAAELLRIPARDGTLLNALRIRPPDWQPGRRYPVWCEVYAGPGAPLVRNAWGGKGRLVDHMLATEGYIVWEVDPRSAAGDAGSAWTAYRRLGVQELADIEDSLRWLIEQGEADPQRIGISGYSYGGFMTCYAMTHSTMFKLGIAGGKVSDWRNYDSIYTERLMQTPQNNPDGYEQSSVVKAAGNLSGRLLLVHGLMDDNVHFINAARLIDALQKASKHFDLMIYPRDRHGIHNGDRHFRELRVRYIRERL